MEKDIKGMVDHTLRKLYGRTPQIVGRIPRHAAVLIPLILKGDEYEILFEERAYDLDVQPGEVCFPGGGIEDGETPWSAVIRETAEELLIDESNIEIVAALDGFVGFNGSMIWPFVGILHDYKCTFSRDEVEQVFTIPVSWLLEHEPEIHIGKMISYLEGKEDFPFDLIPGGKDYWNRKSRHPVTFYRNEGPVLWGLTAKITHDFIKLCRQMNEPEQEKRHGK